MSASSASWGKWSSYGVQILSTAIISITSPVSRRKHYRNSSADGDSSSTIRSTRLETTWCNLHIGLPARLLITDTLRIRDWHGESATYRADLLALIDALGLHDRVDLRPAAYADMPSLYAEADVVVYPTVGEEPYGLVPLEAMSCGSPVVVARSGGLSETVLAVHGKNCTWDISSI